MKKNLTLGLKSLFLAVFLIVSLSSTVLANDYIFDDMVVSPNVLNLESNRGSISVHTNIPYPADDVNLKVNGAEIEDIRTEADNRGNLVVKCSIDTVKEMVAVGEATFILTATYGEDTYTGTDTIAVRQVIPQVP